MLREDKDTPARQRALLDEAATLRALPRHPAFLRLLESGLDPAIGTAFLTMELLGGRTLRAELSAREHAFHPSEVTTAGVVLAGALAELHERGFTHADVAPTNVFVGATHTALSASALRLIDVGAVASVTQPGSELRGIGTPHYLAPERRHGPATPAGDMFALGVVLFEMATKEHPFDRSAPRGRAPALRSLAPHASELLERAIAWMLELDPRRRRPPRRSLPSLR